MASITVPTVTKLMLQKNGTTNFCKILCRRVGGPNDHTYGRAEGGRTRGGKGDVCDLKRDKKRFLTCRRDTTLEVCLVDDCMLDPRCPLPKVVVVGAGMAGLSAAHRLHQCGVTQITILEAGERPGGRVNSYKLDGSVVELGAQYIEGACVANPVYNLVCQEGLLVPPICRVEGLIRGTHQTSKGCRISQLVADTVPYAYKFVEEQAADLYSQAVEDSKLDLRSFIWERVQDEISSYPESSRYHASLVLYSMFNDLRNRMGADLTKVSATEYGSTIRLPGGKIGVGTGLIGSFAPLMRLLTDCNIIYCKPVKNIDWGGGEEPTSGPRVKVNCCDGTVFPCDFCIFTPSLGVLKKDHSTLFTPELPAEKKEAIKRVGFGHVNHAYLVYKHPFWDSGGGNLMLSWTLDELRDRKEWLTAAMAIEELCGTSDVLSITVADKEAICLEKMTDLQIAEDVTRNLRKFLNDSTIPYPINVIQSSWSSNPYFYGARSYIKVGSLVSHQCALATPLPLQCGAEYPKVLFAGEATAPGFYGTLHGARISGIREAERVLSIARKLHGPPRAQKKEEGQKVKAKA